MSGHSKWSQIKRKKAVTDAKRSQIFARLARDISQAARSGTDPDTNANLARAIDRALAANMTKDNIDRAIQKAAGAGGEGLESLLMEAYGPGGVGILVQAMTDNKNRTIAEVKHILSKNEVSLGGANSVMWQFDHQGDQFIAKQPMTLSDADQQKLSELIANLKNHPDVTNVTTTASE